VTQSALRGPAHSPIVGPLLPVAGSQSFCNRAPAKQAIQESFAAALH